MEMFQLTSKIEKIKIKIQVQYNNEDVHSLKSEKRFFNCEQSKESNNTTNLDKR